MSKPDEKVVFCQIDAHLDTNPKIRRAGRDGRDIFEFLLRRVAIGRTNGTVPMKYIEPWYLADQLMMTEDEARHGLSRAVTARLCDIDEAMGVVRIVGWSEEWGRRPKPGAVRTREWRLRSQSGADNQSESHARVTTRDATPSHVTVSDESDALEEKRREEKIERASAEPPPKQKRIRSSKPKLPLPDDWSPRPEEQDQARSLGLNCDTEATKFRNYQHANAKVYADHNAAFRNWLENAHEYAQRRGSNGYARQESVRRLEDL